MNTFASDSPSTSGLPIAAVERGAGLSQNTLRVWGKSHGFPQTPRDRGGGGPYPPLL